jgi:hypothetical protein
MIAETGPSFTLEAVIRGSDGNILWSAKTEVVGEAWTSPAVIAATIADMGNQVADALRRWGDE